MWDHPKKQTDRKEQEHLLELHKQLEVCLADMREDYHQISPRDFMEDVETYCTIRENIDELKRSRGEPEEESGGVEELDKLKKQIQQCHHTNCRWEDFKEILHRFYLAWEKERAIKAVNGRNSAAETA